MTVEQAETPPALLAIRPRRRRRILLATAAAVCAPLVVLGIILWIQRIDITNYVARGVLSERGVEGSWDVESLTLDTAIVRNLRLGSSKNPTLIAPRAEIRWKVDVLSGKGVITDFSATAPRLTVRIDKNGIDFGALTPFLKAESGQSRIDLERATIREAVVHVETQHGTFSSKLDVDGSPAKGWTGRGFIGLPQRLSGSVASPTNVPVLVSVNGRVIEIEAQPHNVSGVIDSFSAKGLSGIVKTKITLPDTNADTLRLTGSASIQAVHINSPAGWVRGARLSVLNLNAEIPLRRIGDATLETHTKLTAETFTGHQNRWDGSGFAADIRATRTGTGGAVLTVDARMGRAKIGQVSAANVKLSTTLSGVLPKADELETLEIGGRFAVAAGTVSMLERDAQTLIAPFRTVSAPGSVGHSQAQAISNALVAALLRARAKGEGRLRLKGLRAVVVSLDKPLTADAASGLKITAHGPGDWATLEFPRGIVRSRGFVTASGGGFPTARLDLSSFHAEPKMTAWSGRGHIEPWTVDGGETKIVLTKFEGSVAGAQARLALKGSVAAAGQFGGVALKRGQVAFDVIAAQNRGSTTLNAPTCLQFNVADFVTSDLETARAAGTICPDLSKKLVSIGQGRPQLFGQLSLEPMTARLGGVDSGQTITLGASVVRAEAGRSGRSTRITLPSVDIAYRLADGTMSKLSWETADGTLTSDGRGGWDIDGAFKGFEATGLPVTLKGDAEGVVRINGGSVLARSRALSVVVSDTLPAPRFAPLLLSGNATLANRSVQGQFTASLVQTRERLGSIALDYNLAEGSGVARFDGDGLTFSRGGLQPAAIAPSLRGVIADVEGTVDAEAQISWSREKPLSSTGVFSSERLNLATALGPMKDVVGALEMTDLLGLVSAPRQKLTVGSFNPGILIEKGIVDFSLTGQGKIAVADARWPLAGGAVFLEPVLWSLGAPQQTVTLDLESIDLEQLLGLMNIPDLEMEGRVSGVFPVIIENNIARIANGRLEADTKGGVIRFRNAAMTETAKANAGTKLAFDALENLEFRILQISVDGAVTGELTLGLIFEGKNEKVLYGTPFRFNVSAVAPFAQLFRSASNMFDSSAALRLLKDQVTLTTPDKPTATSAPIDPTSLPEQPEAPKQR